MNYLYLHECTMDGYRALCMVGLVVWLIFLLYMVRDTADSYFCPPLQIIVDVLHINPNIAGVTFLSFGNGAPDVFAALAAFVGGSSDVGLGGLVGAGIVVTSVVVGELGAGAAHPPPTINEELPW